MRRERRAHAGRQEEGQLYPACQNSDPREQKQAQRWN
jgi:hypothetical protein